MAERGEGYKPTGGDNEKAEKMMTREQRQASEFRENEDRSRQDLLNTMQEGPMRTDDLRKIADQLEENRKAIGGVQSRENKEGFDAGQNAEANADNLLAIIIKDKVGGPSDAIRQISEMLNVYIPENVKPYEGRNLLDELRFRIGVADKFLEKFDKLAPYIELTGGNQNVRRDIVKSIDQAEKFLENQSEKVEKVAA